MAAHGCIEKIALSQLSPHETLHPLYFKEDGIMFEEMRLKLLEYVQIYLDGYYSKFENTTILDICLVGSLASYFYHKDSDIDIAINIQGENNLYIKEDYHQFHKLISLCNSDFLPSSFAQKIRGVPIDVKPFCFEYKYEQKYSLMHNQWVNKFDKELIRKLDVQIILDNYYKKLAEINEHLKKLYGDASLSHKTRNKKLNDYFEYITYEMRNESYLMNIVYRLLRSQGFPQNLGREIALNDLNRINLTGAK